MIFGTLEQRFIVNTSIYSLFLKFVIQVAPLGER